MSSLCVFSFPPQLLEVASRFHFDMCLHYETFLDVLFYLLNKSYPPQVIKPAQKRIHFLDSLFTVIDLESNSTFHL